MKIKSLLLSLVFVFAAFTGANATHLVGGSMSYEYKARLNNGKFRYRVTIRMYRDCKASDVRFDPTIVVGVYRNDPNRTLAQERTFSNPSLSNVPPPRGGSDCDFLPQVCLEQAIYEADLDVDPSAVGYHLVFQRCCRNTQNNIIDDLGQTYYAFIPPTSVQNSSPFFTGVPAPYICANDLIPILNSAVDPDGDSLYYSMVTPWAGGSDTDPIPSTRTSWPQIPNFDNVIYRNNHNTVNPFGPSGTANINPQNGLTNLLAPSTGRYAIAIEVSEYRNGIFLSKIRLDIQMIVIQCPPNARPTLLAQNTTNYSFEVFAGEELCIDFTSTDADNQNIRLKGIGDIFTGQNGWTGSRATMVDGTGKGNALSRFCWTPSCDQESPINYIFTVEAEDDGCPPKKKSENVYIKVKKFIGTRSISGKVNVCRNEPGTVYTANGSPGSTYAWAVTGGTITSGQGSASIGVEWQTTGVGIVEVTETSSGGCKGDPARLNVNVLAAPATPVITGKDTVCEFSSNATYSATSTGASSYSWGITGGSINGSNTNQTVNVSWGAEGAGLLYLVTRNSLGCGSDTGYIPVAIVKARIDSIYGSTSVCPHIKGVEYSVLNSNPASSYVWTISGGTQASGGNTAAITVNWGATGNGTVSVVEISKFGCSSDPKVLPVLINHSLIGKAPSGPDTLCELTTNVQYEVISTHGSTYFWSIQNGTIIQGDSSAAVLVNWGNTGIGRITVYEISYDSVSNIPCIGNAVTLDVFLAPIPATDTIEGPVEICQSASDSTLYVLNGFDDSYYQWRLNGDTTGIRGQGNDSVYVTWNQPGTFTLSVLETSVFGCPGIPVTQKVLVHPKPVTKGIFGDTIVCFPNYSNIAYSATGFATSVFNWAVNSGNITTGQGTPVIAVDWSGQQDNTISLVEVSEFGCLGDTLRAKVFADNPSIDLRVISVGFPEDNHMEVRWSLINAPRYNDNFYIQRRKAGSGDAWVDAGSVAGNINEFIDKPLNTDITAYEYRIKGINLCGNPIYSEIHRNVLITGSKAEDDPYEVHIAWTRYFGWNDGVRTYEVYRKNGTGDYLLTNITGSDTLDSYSDGLQSYTQCYRIKSYELNGSEESWSNEICFNFDPILWIPNAFTPNQDNFNPVFELKGGAIKTFRIEIFDRWGENIFTSEDFTRSWDGTYKGNPCPQDVYMYIARYSGADNKLIIKTGNITLLR